MKNRILLLNPRVEGLVKAPPLGLGYIASSLVKSGYEVQLLDFAVENHSPKDLLNKIKKNNIEIVGITTITPSIKIVIGLADFLKFYFPEIKIIIGGAHATLLPLETLEQAKSIDFIIVGEGENVILKIINFINEKEDLKDTQGIIYRDNGRIVVNEGINYLDNLDIYPVPYRKIINISRYSDLMISQSKPVTSIITSRGCPFKCIYCSKPVTGNKVRQRSIESIIKEIKYLKEEYEVKEIVFYDDIFTIDKARTFKLCEEIIKNKINIKWKCETRVDLIDKGLLGIMEESGCYLIAYGIESGNQRILDFLKKDITREQAENAVKLTHQAGIKTLGYFMLGIPTEGEVEIRQTIDFSKKLDLDYCQFSIAIPYPGTALYELIENKEIIRDGSMLIYSAIYSGDIVSLCNLESRRLKRLLKMAYLEFYFRARYLWKNIRFSGFNELKYKLEGFKQLGKLFLDRQDK